MHVPRHNINLWKVVQVQDKSIMATWLSSCGVGVRSEFTSIEKLSYYGKELNTFVTFAMAKALKFKKESKVRYKDDFDSDSELERFSF